MKKILFQRRNALISPASLSWGVLLLAAVLVFAVTRALFPSAFTAAVAPALRFGASLGDFGTSLRASFSNAIELTRERDSLRSEVVALSSENQTLSAKVDDLTALVGSTPSMPQGLIAGVLAHPPESPYDTLILAIGSSSGVSAGMRALGAGNVPIGTVESVTSWTARVTLYSSPGRTLTAWVGSSRVPVTLTGLGGGSFSASVPKAASVAEGDLVYIANGGAAAIGSVRGVATDLASPSATLSIASIENLFSLTWVKLVP